MYEILWVRQLTVYVGGGAFSVSIVLTVFMGGLALGSAIASKKIDRIRKAAPLIRIYGWLELAIGLYALAFASIVSLLRPVYTALYSLLVTHYLFYNAASGLVSMAVLLLPTTLMGATLPVLCRFYITSLDKTGTRVGFLYGFNTAGGALGSLICGFVCIRYLGMNGTLWMAAAINGGIGLACLSLAMRQQKSTGTAVPERQAGGPLPGSANGRAGIWAILAVSGFCAMSYEVIWTKLLALLAGPTTYSLTVVLFTFITGLALGSMLFGWLGDRVKNPFALLIGSQLVAALSAMLASQCMGNAQLYFAKLLYQFKDHFFVAEGFKALSLFAMMFIPTLCLGAVFPISTKLILNDVEHIGSSIGKLYAVNTVGALLGSFCSGFVLIPLLGKAVGLSGLVAVQFLTACAMLLLDGNIRPGKKWVFLPLGIGMAVLSFFMPRWNANALVQGRYQRFTYWTPILENTSYWKALFSSRRLLDTSPEPRVLYLDDGIGGFVAVCQLENSLGVSSRYLSSSGKIEASTLGDQSTMYMLAHIPMLMHPGAKDVLVIGLGSGITAGQVLCYPVKRLDILEISPEVVRGADYFNEWNNRVLTNPVSRVIVQDARTHITLTKQTYDVITAEPSNLWMAGLANLFTVDYFEKIKNHLNPHGIFVQWFHAYQADWTVFSSIGRTFQQVFGNCMLFRSSLALGDFLFVGFKDENDQMRPDVLEKNVVYLKDLDRIRIRDPYVLYPLIVAENVEILFTDGFLHTDKNPILEYRAPLHLYTEKSAFDETIKSRSRIKPSTRSMLQRFDQTDKKLDFAEFVASLNNPPFNLVRFSDLNEMQKQRYLSIEKTFCENNLYPYPLINDSVSLNLCMDVHETKISGHLEKMLATNPGSKAIGWIHFDLAKVYSYKKEFGKAIRHFNQALVYLPDDFNVLIFLAYTYQDVRDYSNAIAMFQKLLKGYPNAHDVQVDISECYLRNNELLSAKTYIEKAMLRLPFNKKSANTALVIYLKLKEWPRAISLAWKIIRNYPESSLHIYRSIAIALVRDNQYPDALPFIDQGLATFPNDQILLTLQNKMNNKK